MPSVPPKSRRVGTLLSCGTCSTTGLQENKANPNHQRPSRRGLQGCCRGRVSTAMAPDDQRTWYGRQQAVSSCPKLGKSGHGGTQVCIFLVAASDRSCNPRELAVAQMGSFWIRICITKYIPELSSWREKSWWLKNNYTLHRIERFSLQCKTALMQWKH